MAKGKKIKVTPKTASTKAVAQHTPQSAVSGNDGLLFGKLNYVLMLAGVLLIVLGFFLMAGGKTTDPNVFPADEIYSFRRITLAPIVIMIGFAVEIVAIMKSFRS